MSINQVMQNVYSSTCVNLRATKMGAQSALSSAKESIQNKINSIDWESPEVKSRVNYAKSGAYFTLYLLSTLASGFMLIAHLEQLSGNKEINGISERIFEPLTTGTQTLAAVALAKLAFDSAKAAFYHSKAI